MYLLTTKQKQQYKNIKQYEAENKKQNKKDLPV